MPEVLAASDRPKSPSGDVQLEFWLPYGTTEVPVAIPDENLIGFFAPRGDSTDDNLEGVIASALRCRIRDKTLLDAVRQSRSTVIAFNGNSASSSVAANRLAEEFSHVKAEGFCLLESAPDPTQVSSRQLPMEKSFEQVFPVIKHIPESSSCAKVGQLGDGAEVFLNEAFVGAELRCAVTNVAVNPFWGYSGGPSLAIPSLASEKTIKAVLRPAMRSARLPGVLSGNPVHQRLLQASQMTTVNIGIHVVERLDGRVAGGFAGDFLGTFEQACTLASEFFRPPVERKADVVISSAGGSTWDRTLFDASLSTLCAVSSCKDRGIIILIAECTDGLGRFPSAQGTTRDSGGRSVQAQRGFSLERLVEYSLQKLATEHRVYLVSTLPEYQASRFNLLPAKSVASAFQRAMRHVGKDARVTLIPYGTHTSPRVP